MEWDQPHRYYHGLNHLSFLLEKIPTIPYLTTKQIDMLELVALFHDIVYSPRGWNNEEESIKHFKFYLPNNDNRADVQDIINVIRDTTYTSEVLLCPELSKIFCSDVLDLHSLALTKPSEIMESEINVLKEFQWCSYPKYRQQRLEFLKNFKRCEVSQNVFDFLINYRPKIGVYPGSFLPFHIGHMNILEQAEKIFDKVIIAVGKNPDKKDDRLEWSPEKLLPFHEVAYYDGLLSDYLKTLNYADVTVIRGLRSGYDLDYEMQQLRILEDYGCKLPVSYFLCSKETTHISSSMIRGMSKFPNNEMRKYIPAKYSYAF
jgi:pantetheine-phosphate adenylyltransferase